MTAHYHSCKDFIKKTLKNGLLTRLERLANNTKVTSAKPTWAKYYLFIQWFKIKIKEKLHDINYQYLTIVSLCCS